MSGLTKDTVVTLERQLKRYLADGEQLRTQINQVVATIQQAQREDAKTLRYELEVAIDAEREFASSGLRDVLAGVSAFTSMGFAARLRWLFTGKVRPS